METEKFYGAVFLVLFLIATSASASAASSNWNLNALSSPYDLHDVSNNTQTIQLVNLTDNDDNFVDADRLSGDDASLKYVYNKSSGSEVKMQHLSRGYYYANFTVDSTKGLFAEYELEDDSSDGFEENKTEVLNAGNLTVEVLTDFSGTVDPEASFDLKVNVTDEWNDTFEGNGNLDVDLYMTNGSHKLPIKHLNNKERGTHWKNFGQSFDLAYGSKYVLHANATRSDAPYENANGSHSIIVETNPRLSGKIEDLENTAGCNNESFFTECERDAKLDLWYNITTSSAKNVELDLLLENRSSGEWTEEEGVNLSKHNDLWNGSLETPDINTSEYKKKYILRFNATNNNGGQDIDWWNITYRSYRIQDRSPAAVNQGEEYDLEILLGKYFTLQSLNASRFKNATIDVNNRSGDNISSFHLDDMEYDSESGLFAKDVSIPSDAEAGPGYDTEVTAFNIYGEKKEATSSFTVNAVNASFNTSGDIDRELNKTGIHDINITITNKLQSERELEFNVSGDIEDFTEINNGTNLTLGVDETVNATVEFNITSVDEYDGEINITDTGNDYTKTIDVEIEAPECDLRNGTLCLNGAEEWENVTSSNRGYITRLVDVIYLGEKNTTATVNSSVTGDISSYLAVEPSSVELGEVNDTETVTLNYSIQAPGNFSGAVNFSVSGDWVSFNTHLESDITATDTGISVGSADLGYMASGDSATADVDVENTGSVEVTDMYASSSTYDVSIETVSIAAGETSTVELTFSSVETSSGTVTVTGETSQGNISDTLSVSANPVPDYTQEVSSLETRIAELSAQAESDSVTTQLEGLQTTISEIETLYQQGDYQEAQQEYQNVQSELNSIENQISSGAPGQDPGQQNPGQNPGGQPGGNQGQGGAPIIPIAIGLFITLVVGFVAYTSMIPEEGDPLYNLLGE